MTPDAPHGAVSLRLVQPVQLAVEYACAAFAEGATDWLGPQVGSPRDGIRRLITDLSLPVRDHAPAVIFHKAAFVDLGAPRCTSSGCDLEIGWRSSTLAPLFPVFAGKLTMTSTAVVLQGYYAPPGGDVGLVLDRAFLNIAARGTARWLLDRVTKVLATH